MPKALVLTGVTGTKVGMRETLTGRSSTIGSAIGCQLVLHDRDVQARHAEIRQVLDRWFVVPLMPSARIFVNGSPVSSQGRLIEGDLVTIGTATFKASFTEVAERAIGSSAPGGTPGLPRLGEYLIRRGVVSRSQIDQAIQRQEELRSRGRSLQLGDVLYELGFVSRLDLNRALQDQSGDFQGNFKD
jgi:Inner membrane component of T3SS, cytoplasmic domain